VHYSASRSGGDETKDVSPKLAYAAPFEPWHWAICTGFYIDDIDGVGTTHGQLGATVNIPVVGCQKDYTATFNQPGNSVSLGVYQFVVTINHSPQGATTPPPLDQQLTENVGYAQSSPVKVTPTVKESN